MEKCVPGMPQTPHGSGSARHGHLRDRRPGLRLADRGHGSFQPIPHRARVRLSPFTFHITQLVELNTRVYRQSALPAERVAVLCDALRAELGRVDLRNYVNAVLTAHVVKRPPDMEGALGVLLALRGMSISCTSIPQRRN